MKAILTPFLLAVLAAYLLNPLIVFMEQRGIRRKTAVIVFYFLSGTAASVLAAVFLPKLAFELEDIYAHWPQKLQSLRTVGSQAAAWIADYFPAAAPVLAGWEDRIYRLLGGLAGHLPEIASNFFHFLTWLFLVPFLSFFFLAEGPKFTENVLAACPGRHVEKALNVIASVGSSLGKYLRALLLDALCISLLAILGLWMIGLEYSLTLGILTGVSGLIPYLGPLAMGAVSAGFAAVQFHNLEGPLQVAALFAVLRFLDDWILQPYIMSRTVHLHPAALLLSLMIGGHFFGLLGLILAAPAACVLRVIFGTIWEWYLTESGLKIKPSLREHPVPLV